MLFNYFQLVMRSFLGDSLVEELLYVFPDLLFLFFGDLSWVFDSVVLKIGRDEFLANLFRKFLEILFRKLVAELIHNVFDVGEKLRIIKMEPPSLAI